METFWKTGNNEKKNEHARIERRRYMSVRKFKITIDGKLFEAEVEELTKGEPAAVENKREVQKTTTPSPTPSKPAFSGSGNAVLSPMPGKIIAVKCTQGQTVKPGDVLVVLEAMKMEQEIKAKTAGTIAEIKVAAGKTVQKDEELVVIS
jgi:glutaconyl-CoA/methylmalonyl-CoA decarboxylase subunit gamma